MTISRLTLDKLGVKLYDRVSAALAVSGSDAAQAALEEQGVANRTKATV